ncbi:MAG: V-type ATP synthase subunit A, partial [Dehalococcoidia bacterium]|nr:V-type ATP synthase subunit A [Dehalococcoidia bacterium]
QQEAELEEIVRLVGPEALPEEDKLLLLTSRMIREDFLQQSAYHEVDTYCTPGKAGLMLRTITKFYDLSREMLNSGAGIESIRSSPMVYKISRMKDIPNEDFAQRAGELWSEMEGSLVARKRVA